MANCAGTNRDGEPCGRKVPPGEKYCYSCRRPRGLAAAAYKHGGRSKSLANLGWADRFERALGDPDLVSHRNNVALVETMIEAELENSAPPGFLWREAINLYEKALEGDEKALGKLGEVLMNGERSTLRMDRVLELMNQQRKHKSAETRRLAELETGWSAREVSAFFGEFQMQLDRLPDDSRRILIDWLSEASGARSGRPIDAEWTPAD